MLAVNLDGTFLGCKYALPLLKRGGGSIVNLSSISGIVGGHNLAAYNASKGGVRLLTKSIALHGARLKPPVRCNSLHPAFLEGPMVEDILAQTGRPEVARVLHPALPGDPGHEIWKRDFRGSSSLFSVLLRTRSEKAVAAMVDGLGLFKIGASFGGFESLVVPVRPERTARPWSERGFMIRLHVGLETVEDLIVDLEAGFARLGAVLRAEGEDAP